MTVKRVFSAASAAVLALTLSACGTKTESSTVNTEKTDKSDKTAYKEFDGVYAARLTPVNDGNEIQQLIAEKTGVILKQQFIADQDDINKTFSDMIIKNKYPDFMATDSTNCQELI